MIIFDRDGFSNTTSVCGEGLKTSLMSQPALKTSSMSQTGLPGLKAGFENI